MAKSEVPVQMECIGERRRLILDCTVCNLATLTAKELIKMTFACIIYEHRCAILNNTTGTTHFTTRQSQRYLYSL